jgi:hypothetical protein
MSSFAEGLVTDVDGWEALPTTEPGDSARPANGAHYREMAHGLRKLARQCRFPGARTEILQLAATYDRRADHIERRERWRPLA